MNRNNIIKNSFY